LRVPTVSVVIPCYNGLPYLPESLRSALAQTHRPAEIIVVDDGSKDASAETVKSFAAQHPDRGIKLIQQANAGEPSARNAGIRAATGEWVAQLDTDDWWEPDKLAKQLAAAADPASGGGPDCVMVHTGVEAHFPDGRSEKRDLTGPARRTGRCTAALLEPTSIGHPSVMARRDALEKIGGYDPTFKQACDIDMYFRLSAVGGFAFVPEHLLHYRYHPRQMSASQIDQIGYHHRAVRKFFAAHPEIEREIGKQKIDAALAEHVSVKLESLYWRRRLPEFRQLLEYAEKEKLDSQGIRGWRSKARFPDWLIQLKDRWSGGAQKRVPI
jgi:glycosyltransferase involved in cell wall biosynthesis